MILPQFSVGLNEKVFAISPWIQNLVDLIPLWLVHVSSYGKYGWCGLCVNSSITFSLQVTAQVWEQTDVCVVNTYYIWISYFIFCTWFWSGLCDSGVSIVHLVKYLLQIVQVPSGLSSCRTYTLQRGWKWCCCWSVELFLLLISYSAHVFHIAGLTNMMKSDLLLTELQQVKTSDWPRCQELTLSPGILHNETWLVTQFRSWHT